MLISHSVAPCPTPPGDVWLRSRRSARCPSFPPPRMQGLPSACLSSTAHPAHNTTHPALQLLRHCCPWQPQLCLVGVSGHCHPLLGSEQRGSLPAEHLTDKNCSSVLVFDCSACRERCLVSSYPCYIPLYFTATFSFALARVGLGIILGRGFYDNSGINWPFILNIALLCVMVTL